MSQNLSRTASIKALRRWRPRVLKLPTITNPDYAPLRTWRASLIRKRTRVLGDVQASTREQAEMAAIDKFNLDDEQCNRLVCRRGVEIGV
jgi:hypothetical protein